MKRKTLLLSTAVLLLGITAAGGTTTRAAGETVEIPDSYLRQAVCNTLGKSVGSVITADDMLTITELSSDDLPYVESPAEDLKEHNRGIESLDGLQYAENLTSLDLSENRISDLTPLAGLDHLTYLELDRNNIRDLSPLAGLTSLEHLNIYNNFLESTEPLSGLSNLEFLDMHYANREGTAIDHTPLSSLTALTYLSVESNHLTDISFLEPLVESGNLKTILVRANAITDFSLLSDLLYEEYSQMYPGGMPGFEGPEDTEIMVGTNNQVPWSETLELNAPAAGGEVRVPLPEFKGFEKVEAHYSFFMSIMEMSTLKQLSLDTVDDSITVYYDDSTNEAVFQFPQNIVGTSKDISTTLILGIYGTDFEAQFPIHIVQPARLKATLNIENGAKNLLFIDTSKEDRISSDYVTGAVTNADGTPCNLDAVEVTFEGTCENMNRYSQDMFTAEDIEINGNTFRFRIAQDQAKGFDSNFLLNPTITLHLQGSNESYTLERGTLKIRNAYVSEEAPGIPESGLVFDISTAQGGQYSSDVFTLEFPKTMRTIQSVTVIADDESRLTATVSEDKTGFTVAAFDSDALKKNYTARISLYPLKDDIWDSPIEISLQPTLVYGASNPEIEKQLTLAPLSFEAGRETPLTLMYGDVSCTAFTAVSQNTDLLDIAGTTATGLKSGSTGIHVSDILIPYPVGSEMMDVCYLPGKTFSVSITGSAISPGVPDKDADTQTGRTDTAHTGSVPQTGDTGSPVLWLILSLSALAGIRIRKK